jgi:thioredoxin-like negative regulator of GroEL
VIREARPGLAADRLLVAAWLTPPGAGRDGLLLDAVQLLLQAGDVVEAAAFTERIAALPDTAQRRLVRARLAWMAGRHENVEALAATVWEDGGDTERASAATMLAQMRFLRNDNAGAAHWAERALHAGELPTSELRFIQAVGLALSGNPDEGLRLLE